MVQYCTGSRIVCTRRATDVTGHLSGEEIAHEGDSVADVWSKRFRGREEHDNCFEGPNCAAERF